MWVWVCVCATRCACVRASMESTIHGASVCLYVCMSERKMVDETQEGRNEGACMQEKSREERGMQGGEMNDAPRCI